MPFIMRNAQGRIIAVLSEEAPGAEMISAESGELRAFLQNESPETRAQKDLVESDLSMIRVLEDLIDVMIEKNLILFTDMPGPAQKKLLDRRGLRKEFSYMDSLFGTDDFNPDQGGGGGGEDDNNGGGGYL